MWSEDYDEETQKEIIHEEGGDTELDGIVDDVPTNTVVSLEI